MKSIIILIIIILLLIISLIIKKSKLTKSIEIVIARYNENLKWTLDYPFNQYKYIVYNKGINDNYEKSNVVRSYKLNNVGREGHAFLYHIINNYDNLSDIVVFLPGSVDLSYKYIKAYLLLILIKIYNNAVFQVDLYRPNGINNDLYDVRVIDYKTSSNANREILSDKEKYTVTQSKIYPYGKWYNHYFNFNIKNSSHFGIFSISKKDILNHSKEYYLKLIKDLEHSSNPEEIHYFEKSWEAVFYPLNNTIKSRLHTWASCLIHYREGYHP